MILRENSSRKPNNKNIWSWKKEKEFKKDQVTSYREYLSTQMWES